MAVHVKRLCDCNFSQKKQRTSEIPDAAETESDTALTNAKTATTQPVNNPIDSLDLDATIFVDASAYNSLTITAITD